jgi:hypothetical protein
MQWALGVSAAVGASSRLDRLRVEDLRGRRGIGDEGVAFEILGSVLVLDVLLFLAFALDIFLQIFGLANSLDGSCLGRLDDVGVGVVVDHLVKRGTLSVGLVVRSGRGGGLLKRTLGGRRNSGR